LFGADCDAVMIGVDVCPRLLACVVSAVGQRQLFCYGVGCHMDALLHAVFLSLA
jgi:hypothetical protein